MPRVVLDATAVPADRGGVGRYVDGLVNALDDAGADLAVVCQPRDVDIFARSAPRTEVVPAPDFVATRPLRLAWEQTLFPSLAKKLGAEVIHSPHYTVPLRATAPVVVTLHDATFFSDPAVHLGTKATFFRVTTRIAVRSAALCIVPSNATRDEVARRAHADPTKLLVAYHGVDPTVFAPTSHDAVSAFRARHDLGQRPYVAFLGTLEPRKNVPTLIRAFGDAAPAMVDPPVLLLAGARGWDTDIDEAVNELTGKADVRALGYLPLEDLSVFLGGAALVAYPSLGEGFGLPVLEAMASGAAVLTSRELALPEVGGDAVAYAGTTRAELAQALIDLLHDEVGRNRLRVAAFRRAAQFTWSASAERHMRAYELAARRGR